jgi:DNA-binding NarL/FixJ family response regulator
MGQALKTKPTSGQPSLPIPVSSGCRKKAALETAPRFNDTHSLQTSRRLHITNKQHTILLLDSYPISAEGIRLQLSANNKNIITASNSQHALKQASQHEALSLILLGSMEPDVNETHLISTIKKRFPDIPLAVISEDDSITSIQLAMQLGASGYILKSQPPEKLRMAVETLLTGKNWLPDNIQYDLDATKNRIAADHRLTPRQYSVLLLIQAGLCNKLIAESLNISETTVKTHVSALFKAFGAKNRTMCVRTARMNGLLE